MTTTISIYPKDLIKEFGSTIKSPETRRKYIIYTINFFNFCNKPIEEVTYFDIEKWLENLLLTGHERKNVTNNKTGLTKFLRFACEKGIIKTVPMIYGLPKNHCDRLYLFASDEKVKYVNEILKNKDEHILFIPEMNEMTNHILDEFMRSLWANGLTRTSMCTIGYTLKNFFKSTKTNIKDLTSAHVLAYVSPEDKEFAAKTIKLRLTVLRNLSDFVNERGYMQTDLVKSRWYPRSDKKVPKAFLEKELAIIKVGSEKLSLRNRTILIFLLKSAARCAETANLKISDIDFDKQKAKVLGKGQVERYVTFDKECSILLKSLINESAEGQVYVFVNKRNKQKLHPHYIWMILNAFGKELHLSKSLHPHAMRHSCASHMLFKGENIENIRRKLGHKKITTTMIYLTMPIDKIRLMHHRIMG